MCIRKGQDQKKNTQTFIIIIYKCSASCPRSAYNALKVMGFDMLDVLYTFSPMIKSVITCLLMMSCLNLAHHTMQSFTAQDILKFNSGFYIIPSVCEWLLNKICIRYLPRTTLRGMYVLR